MKIFDKSKKVFHLFYLARRKLIIRLISVGRSTNFTVIALIRHIDLNLSEAIFAIAEVVTRREDNAAGYK